MELYRIQAEDKVKNWKCFCGGIKFIIIKVIQPDSVGNGERAVIALCESCRRRLKFNKHGMKTIEKG